MKNVVVLSIDRLHIGFLGAYGNAWLQTPNFDKLASESLVYDQFYGTENKPFPLESLHENGYHSVLLTDDSDVRYSPCCTDFKEFHLLESPKHAVPVRSVSETQIFKCFATAADVLDSLVENVENVEKKEPFYLWCHFSSFDSCWDFPFERRLKFQEDGDPTPYSGTDVPSERLSKDSDPDLRQSIVEAYSAGISIFDESLGGLLEFLSDSRFADTMFVLFSPRGIPMGEHGIIGIIEDATAEAVGYAETLHVPLVVRFPNGAFESHRNNSLTVQSDVNRIILDWLEIEKYENTREAIVFQKDCLLTKNWFLRNGELYAKPEDRFEVNNVADRCQEAVLEITVHFRPHISQMST